jgi:hypothetical protein
MQIVEKSDGRTVARGNHLTQPAWVDRDVGIGNDSAGLRIILGFVVYARCWRPAEHGIETNQTHCMSGVRRAELDDRPGIDNGKTKQHAGERCAITQAAELDCEPNHHDKAEEKPKANALAQKFSIGEKSHRDYRRGDEELCNCQQRVMILDRPKDDPITGALGGQNQLQIAGVVKVATRLKFAVRALSGVRPLRRKRSGVHCRALTPGRVAWSSLLAKA